MAEQCKLDFSTIPELIGKENLDKGWNDLREKKRRRKFSKLVGEQSINILLILSQLSWELFQQELCLVNPKGLKETKLSWDC